MHVEANPTTWLAGMLLTGGVSRRMGFDKASLSIDGVPVAVRLAGALCKVATMVIEVGPGTSGLPAVCEEHPGSGPLVAVATGARRLREAGHCGPVLVLACDLPLLTDGVLRMLAAWPGDRSVVPMVGGHPQPLCARWSAEDLAAAGRLAEAGERSMRALLERPRLVLLDEASWPAGIETCAFSDTDTPADLDRLRLCWQPGTGSTGRREIDDASRTRSGQYGVDRRGRAPRGSV